MNTFQQQLKAHLLRSFLCLFSCFYVYVYINALLLLWISLWQLSSWKVLYKSSYLHNSIFYFPPSCLASVSLRDSYPILFPGSQISTLWVDVWLLKLFWSFSRIASSTFKKTVGRCLCYSTKCPTCTNSVAKARLNWSKAFRTITGFTEKGNDEAS